MVDITVLPQICRSYAGAGRTSLPTPLASAPERLVGVAVTMEDEAGGSAIIEATGEHPIWVGDTDNGGGYVEVQDLAVGDVLRTDDGRTAWVSDLQGRSGTVDVFNFEVAGLHNYFVEELAGVGVLVHNASGCFDGAVAAAQDAVASKAVPKVHMGKQGKHILGHNNFKKGRSVLTADPKVLAKQAGTGTPANKVARGEAGFKERIDFGEVIGDHVVDGVATPTTNGLVTYAGDGSIHIILAAP